MHFLRNPISLHAVGLSYLLLQPAPPSSFVAADGRLFIQRLGENAISV